MAELAVGQPRPFPIAVVEQSLEDLERRLATTRWPERETVDDWGQGVPLAYMQEICRYWQQDYNWRWCEAQLNALGSYVVEVDGLDIHFLHCRSQHAAARPLVLTHGWPGSVVEFLDIIPMLTRPEAFGGKSEDAFHVVAPTLPGFGFSGKPEKTGWTVEHIADAWNALMACLGYEAYFAQGGDWGAFVTTELARRHQSCLLAHINLVIAVPDQSVVESPTQEEARALQALAHHRKDGTGYSLQQSTRPQTLGYGLTDSPIGQAAWILEKFYEWTDNTGTPDSVTTRERLLDNVMMYWITASAASSARLYWESFRTLDRSPMEAPIACAVFPEEISAPSRRWAETRFRNIVHWTEAPAGGHFAALEQPEFLCADIQSCFRNHPLDHTPG